MILIFGIYTVTYAQDRDLSGILLKSQNTEKEAVKGDSIKTDEWDISIVSVDTISSLSRANFIGTDQTSLKPKNGIFLLVTISAKPKQNDISQFYPIKSNIYILNQTNNIYPLLGNFQEEEGVIYLSMLAGSNKMGPNGYESSTCSYYFDIPNSSGSYSLHISNSYPTIELKR